MALKELLKFLQKRSLAFSLWLLQFTRKYYSWIRTQMLSQCPCPPFPSPPLRPLRYNNIIVYICGIQILHKYTEQLIWMFSSVVWSTLTERTGSSPDPARYFLSVLFTLYYLSVSSLNLFINSPQKKLRVAEILNHLWNNPDNLWMGHVRKP